MSQFQTLKQATNYLESFIPKKTKQNYTKDWGLNRVKELLNFLDNPQEKYQVLHVAGTSGKGSTAYFAANLLHSQNYKTCLHVSPYVKDFLERFQISNPKNSNLKLISSHKFLQYFQVFNEKLEDFIQTTKQKPTYFELVVALAYFIFAEEKVDVAVIEVGIGGRFDCTNVVKNPNKICLLNQAGFDHTKVLGKKITEIAMQQAGIINKGNIAFIIKQKFAEAEKIHLKIANQKAKYFELIEPKFEPKTNLELAEVFSKFPDYQLQNFELAYTGANFFLQTKQQKWNFDSAQNSLKNLQIPGRFEIWRVGEKTLIFDAAHNVQKMEVFLTSLKSQFPKQKFDFVLAFSSDKDATKMLQQIRSLAKNIILTEFRLEKNDGLKTSFEIKKLQKELQNFDFDCISFEQNYKTAVSKILQNSESEMIIFSGSIYFLTNIFDFLKRQLS